MMELKQNLPVLTKRTRDLYNEINEKFHYDDGISFCKHCLEHGLCCWISETTMEERKRMISIRDSLKDVQDMLVILQTLESRGQTHENAAFTRLEASRLLLVEKINQYPGRGRKVEVLEELNAWLGNRETAFTWKLKDYKEVLGRRKGKNVGCCKSRGNFLSNRGILSPTNPKMARKLDFAKNINASSSHVDVFYGRG